MNDESGLGETNFLDPEWERAWGKLRHAGYSDSEIWEMAASVEDADWPEDPPLGNAKEHYYAELISRILDLRDKALNEDHPPSEWILDGMGIAYTLSLAGDADQAKEFLSAHQKRIQRSERNRKGKADDVVDYVLDRLPADERGMTEFREYVIRHTTLDLEYAKIDVTPGYDEYDEDTITHYVFENRSISDDDPKATVEVSFSAVRSSIHRYPKRLAKRLKNQSAE